MSGADDPYAALKRSLGDACAAWYDFGANRFDYRGFAGSAERRALADATASLAEFPCSRLGVAKRLPFWLNAYNALVLEAVAAGALDRAAGPGEGFFAQSQVVVEGHALSLDDIEHGLIRVNAPRYLSMRRQMPEGDPRLALAPQLVDERAHFALHSACVSSPRLRAFGKDSLDAALERAACDYLRESVRVEDDGAVLRVPRIFRWYRRDFDGERGVRRFVIDRLEREEDIEPVARRDGRCTLRYLAFDWTLNAR